MSNLSSANSLDQQYLLAIFNWLDLCLEKEVTRWQIAGQNPTDKFRGLYTSDKDALVLTQRGFGTSWGTNIRLSDQEEKSWEKAKQVATNAILAVEEKAKQANVPLRLKTIQNAFNLCDFEWWATITCLAPEIDLRYEKIFGYLQDDITQHFASINLIINLLLPDDPTRLEALAYFSTSSPLQKFRLIQPIEENGKRSSCLRQAYQSGTGLLNWVIGNYHPINSIGDFASFLPCEPDDGKEDSYIPDGLPSLDLLLNEKPILAFLGDDQLQHEMSAKQLANNLKKNLLQVDLGQFDEKEALEKLRFAIRDGRLNSAVLYLQEFDTFCDKEGYLSHDATFVVGSFADLIIVSCKTAFKFSTTVNHPDLTLFQIPFSSLSATERLEFWTSLIEGVPQEISKADLETLAGQFNLSSTQIVAAASTAVTSAIQFGRALISDDLFNAARFHSGHHLSELAHKIEPRYEWTDLVLPETPITMLKEMVSMCQTRTMVLDTWGLGKKLASGTGISALFSGPPGTGKTLAAQIMANQLGIDLYRIDLSTIVSKYVGETEKNLERIFKEASESNAILFFDEADTIFGKRSEVKDAQDRYANIEVGYLLQKMESYNGVAILATNLRANLDDAFTRRLHFIVNFPFPDEEHRHRIWQVLLPPSMPIEKNIDLKKMASRFKLAGGNIRNIIVSAAYFAAADGRIVTMDHLMHGAKRELQKMGKLIHEGDFAL